MVISAKYGDDRRTSIGYDEYDISMEDLIPVTNTVIAMTKLGYIKRMSADNFRAQHRGGRGIKGMETIDDDYIEELFMTTSHHYLMFFTNTGKVYRMKAYEIPEASRTARGTAIINLLQLAPGEKITAVIPICLWQPRTVLLRKHQSPIMQMSERQVWQRLRYEKMMN